MFYWVKDAWGRWAIDVAGRESGQYSGRDLRAMLDSGEVSPRTWLRHAWTRKFSLVGEVLYGNRLATAEEFERWFPSPRFGGGARVSGA